MTGTLRRIARAWLPWIGGGIAAAWVLSMLWWALLEPAQAQEEPRDTLFQTLKQKSLE